jgi:hypothetical protein
MGLSPKVSPSISSQQSSGAGGSSGSTGATISSIFGSNYKFDLDPSVTNSLNLTSATVNSWTDLASSIVMIPPAAAQSPTLLQNEVSGWPSIDFPLTASNERMISTGTTFNIMATGSVFRVYMIAKHDTLPAAGSTLFDISVGGTSNRYFMVQAFNAAAHDIRAVYDTVPNFVDATDPPAFFLTGSYYLYTAEVTSTTIGIYRNNVLLKSGDWTGKSFGFTPNRLTIGALANAVQVFDGKIARMFIVMSPTAQQITDTNTYLKRRYPTLGLT